MRHATRSAVAGQAPGGGDGPGGGSGPGGGRRLTRRELIATLVLIVLAAGVVAGYTLVRHRQQAGYALPPPSGLPAGISASLGLSMQLSPVPARAAPGFTLTDQNGRPVSLASLRGRAVVLDFMDPHCTDICPIVSAEFVDAYRDLGPAAGRAVFVAVNVNPYFHAPADVAAFSAAHGLTAIPSWRFLTGSLPALRQVWASYQVVVQAPSRTGDIIHSSLLYFIDPSGRERFVAAPMDDHTRSGKAYLPAPDQAAWGAGIAQTARDLLR